MKLEDLREIQLRLNKLRDITSKVNYNVSITSNQEILKIESIISEEEKRIDKSKLDLQGPQYLLIRKNIVDNTLETEVEKEVIKMLNEKLLELVANKNEIIDYGLGYRSNNCLEAYIKYTS